MKCYKIPDIQGTGVVASWYSQVAAQALHYDSVANFSDGLIFGKKTKYRRFFLAKIRASDGRKANEYCAVHFKDL